MIVYTLPYPPSINHYWIAAGRGRRRLSDQGEAFRKEVWVACVQQRQIKAPLQGQLAVTVRLTPGDRIRRDIDNPIKPLLDALEHAGVYGNDSQISELDIMRGAPDPGHARCVVKIESATGAIL